mmetsp:Transcript_31392/g.101485  ORF Transcript_31392/g.101485 Transcript_31392/m.101485 type:complete len:349 (+) Transcript_31392:963-2009(+)
MGSSELCGCGSAPSAVSSTAKALQDGGKVTEPWNEADEPRLEEAHEEQSAVARRAQEISETRDLPHDEPLSFCRSLQPACSAAWLVHPVESCAVPLWLSRHPGAAATPRPCCAHAARSSSAGLRSGPLAVGLAWADGGRSAGAARDSLREKVDGHEEVGEVDSIVYSESTRGMICPRASMAGDVSLGKLPLMRLPAAECPPRILEPVDEPAEPAPCVCPMASNDGPRGISIRMPDRELVREPERGSGSVEPPEIDSDSGRRMSTVVCDTSRPSRSGLRAWGVAGAAHSATSCESQAWWRSCAAVARTAGSRTKQQRKKSSSSAGMPAGMGGSVSCTILYSALTHRRSK